MNLFSNLLLLLLLFSSSSLWAINVKSVYISACKREVGVIVGVNNHDIHLLNVDGNVKTIPRHNVIFLADYPMDILPVRSSVDLSSIKQVQVYTRINNRIVPLVKGWPIGFSKEKISFLNKNGKEIVIDRRNIWEVQYSKISKPLRFKTSETNFNFIPPYSFRECVDRYNIKKSRDIYPQQVLANPVVIKRELDVLQAGHKQIERYNREQDFYPVPIIYHTETSIGIWHNIGSKHGSSEKRPNNFLPFIKDSYMADVFDYQHQFISGSHPMHFSVHEESQVQAYYNFKDSYFHFTAMIDPNLILIGKNYQWQESDFTEIDDRLNDTNYFEMGFDFGQLSFGMASNGLSLGVYDGNLFDHIQIPVSGLVAYYQNHLFKIEASFKSGSSNETSSNSVVSRGTELLVSRANIYFNFIRRFDLSYSLIHRKLKFNDLLNYSSQSLVNAFYLDYSFNDKYKLGGMISIEGQKISSYSDKDNLIPKMGLYMSLSF
ncbi:MAG: hypothetical protein KDD50_09520 [Bdellovibrionales bacterium]|nr:hypothetical protein [Bdellovibrionales bacterium]